MCDKVLPRGISWMATLFSHIYYFAHLFSQTLENVLGLPMTIFHFFQ